jgi:hypothetical protein
MQPVEIRGPKGMRIAVETAAGWSPLQEAPLRIGLVVGRGYRLKVTGIPGRPGEELYPSVRVLAKLVTPPGTAWRFPVEITMSAASSTPRARARAATWCPRAGST